MIILWVNRLVLRVITLRGLVIRILRLRRMVIVGRLVRLLICVTNIRIMIWLPLLRKVRLVSISLFCLRRRIGVLSRIRCLIPLRFLFGRFARSLSDFRFGFVAWVGLGTIFRVQG